MSSGLIRFAVAGLLAIAVVATSNASFAQQSPATPAAPAAPASPAPTAPVPVAPSPAPAKPAEATNPAPAAPGAAQPAEPTQSGEGATGETIDLTACLFAYIEGKADKDEISRTLVRSASSSATWIRRIAPAGRPLAVFVESDDSGFKYHAGYPLSAAPEGKSSLSDAVKIGQTPSGKAMRFEHQGAYGDIDATYVAMPSRPISTTRESKRRTSLSRSMRTT